jgi:hypothetical protein
MTTQFSLVPMQKIKLKIKIGITFCKGKSGGCQIFMFV